MFINEQIDYGNKLFWREDAEGLEIRYTGMILFRGARLPLRLTPDDNTKASEATRTIIVRGRGWSEFESREYVWEHNLWGMVASREVSRWREPEPEG